MDHKSNLHTIRKHAMDQNRTEQLKMAPNVRPRFKKLSQEASKDIEQRFRSGLADKANGLTGHFVDGYVAVKIAKAQQHFWSPELSLSFETTESGTLIRGLYGPDPTLWAFFFYGRAAMVLLAFMFSVVLFSEWWLNGDLTAALYMIASLMGGAVLYVVAQVGRYLGQDQVLFIHRFVETCLGEHLEVD